MLFDIGMVNEPYYKVLLLVMGEGYAAIERGAGRASSSLGGGDSLMNHSAGSVTTQSTYIAFKYVMASEPCRYS